MIFCQIHKGCIKWYPRPPGLFYSEKFILMLNAELTFQLKSNKCDRNCPNGSAGGVESYFIVVLDCVPKGYLKGYPKLPAELSQKKFIFQKAEFSFQLR